MPTNVSLGGADGCDAYVGQIGQRDVVRARGTSLGLRLVAPR